MKNERKALVLGGGGITGIAWELGVIAGLADLGVDLTDADVLIGTSAGSVVGALLTGGTPLAELYDQQLADPAGEVADRLGRSAVIRYVLAAMLPGGSSRSVSRA